MRRRAALVVLAATLATAACGGSSAGSASSGARAAPFCESARSIVASLRGNVLTDPRGAARAADAVAGLQPPAEIADKWPAFVAYVRAVAAINPRAPDAAAQAMAALGKDSADISAVGSYLVDTCQIETAASDLTDLS